MSKVRNIVKLLKIFGTKESYAIGYRNHEGEDISYRDARKYTLIMPSKTEWYADPFLFEYQGKTYLFAEIMKDENNWRGVLGVCCLSDNETHFEVVLSESFHLSYPFVFSYKDEIYMMPETYSSNQLRLYKCKNFPNNWELEWILLDAVHFVDTTLFFF